MKKNLFALITLFAFGFSNAQVSDDNEAGFSTGDIFVTGSVGFSNSKVENLSTDSFTFSPKAGYFINDNIALGITVGYSKAENLFNNYDITETVTTMQTGAFGRYYFMPANRFSVFTQLSLNYIVEDIDYSGLNILSTYTSRGFNVAFAPGINYFISNRFALEANFGIIEYTSLKTENPGIMSDDISSNSFSLGLNMTNINIGLLYKF